MSWTWKASNRVCIGCYARYKDSNEYETAYCACWLLGCLYHKETKFPSEEHDAACCLGPCLLTSGYRKNDPYLKNKGVQSYIQLLTPFGVCDQTKSANESEIQIRLPCGSLQRVETNTQQDAVSGAAKEPLKPLERPS